MNSLSSYTGKIIEVELSSKKNITGKLIEVGSNIIVLFNGNHFVYLPVQHILCLKKGQSAESDFLSNEVSPIFKDGNQLSFRKVLTNAVGIFVEILISGGHVVYGYIKDIQDDYIVCHSPAFNIMIIPIVHVKWLIPYLNQTPYQINAEQQPVPSEGSFAQTFKEQLKVCIGKMVIFDVGKDPQKVGLLTNVEDNLVELITGTGQILHFNIEHLKSLHG
jgi:ferredoxin-fold anticodon binding domain-containing protein